MKVGDLVKWKPDLPVSWPQSYGIVVEIINSYTVGVVWFGSDCVYQEPIDNLEIIDGKGRSG